MNYGESVGGDIQEQELRQENGTYLGYEETADLPEGQHDSEYTGLVCC